MVVKRRVGLLLSGTVLGASLLAAVPAFADDAKNQQLQNQINAMQQQLQALQDQLQQTKQQAKAAQQAVQNIPAGVYDQAPAGAPMVTKGPPAWLGGIHISMSGTFIEAATVFRQHNEVSSGASDPAFSGLPFHNSPLWSENEWRASAQQSRLAFRAYGDIDPVQHLQAYYEQDFLGAGVTANSRESNSYNLRVRQAWLTYDNDNAHFHVMAGQGWSMLTQNRVGITPLYENVPLTIDAQYVVGFNWARQEQLRFVEDWNQVAWFGVSIESPQAAIGPATAPPGTTVTANSFCNSGGLLNDTTTCSNDVAPDVVEKFALDPGWGHYEVVGLQRWFADEVATAAPNSWSQQVTFGWGVGGSFLVPAIPKYLDLQGSVLAGDGIGRYSSSQLADVTVGPNGRLSPLSETEVLLGAVGHPMTGLDIYAYAGQDQVNSRDAWTIGAVKGGYGNTGYANGGCFNENLAGGTNGALGTGPAFNTPIVAGTCNANIRSAQELSIGFWDTVYKGDVGRVVWGMQYEFVQLHAFTGSAAAGPTPNAGLNPNNNVVFTSIRYYPFN